jgi:DNA-binding IclR family transcriptional regulator
MSLSPAATIVLTRAALRPDHRLEFHRKLPTGGRHKMIDALLRDGMIAETKGDYRLGEGCTLIEDTATGLMLTTLAITDAGMAAIGQAAPTQTTAAPDADTAPHAATDTAVAQEAAAIADTIDAATAARTAASPGRPTLHHAAQAVLAAWDDEANRETDIIAAMEAPMNALRALLGGKAARDAGAPRKPRTGTKQEAVLALLRRTEGASVAQIAEATGWAGNTVRGFLAGLKKKGVKVEALDRVQMIGPGKQGAKGSYSIYHVG